jgi:hypothetical protein
MSDPYIHFDMAKVETLKTVYELNLEFILEELPEINWDSAKQVKKYFSENFDIKLENVKIDHVLSHLEEHTHDSPAFDVINGFVLYLRSKFTLKNYIGCIERHAVDGKVTLRSFGGSWVLPNRRPISLNPEIEECVIARGVTNGS